VSSEGDKQHGHMGDRAVVLRRRQACHCGPLHGDRQETRKDPLCRCSLIIGEFESACSVGDLITDGGGQADEIVTALLVEELRMGGRAEKILPSILLPPVKRAGVLDIRSCLDSHFTPSVHFQKGGTGDDSFPDAERSWGSIAEVSGNNGFCFHLEEDMGKDFFGIVIGIPDDTFWREGEGFLSLPEKRNGLLFLIMVGWKSPLMKGKFRDHVIQNMISVSPEPGDFRLKRLRVMEENTQPGIGVARELASFVKPVVSRGFEIIFLNVSLDRTGVQSQVLSCDYAFLNETVHESEPNGLKITLGLGSQELRKPFFGVTCSPKCRHYSGPPLIGQEG